MESPLTREGKMEHISQRILFLIVTYVTNKNFFSGREITKPYNKQFNAWLVRSAL